MRSILPCSYVPKHAAPREPLGLEARSVLAVGLAAAVLPLGAAPALADEAPAASTTSTTSGEAAAAPAPSPSTAAATPPAAEATPSAAPAAKAAATEEPSPYAVGSASASRGASSDGTASPRATASPSSSASSAPSRGKASTSLSLTAPSSASGSAVRVGIRLLSDGKGVKNGFVRLEKSTSSGWTYAGRLLTNEQGLGKGTLKVAGSTRLRAAYTGSKVRTPAVSQARTVRAALRSTAGDAVLQEAAKHVGKPYRYGAVGPDSFDCSGFTRYVFGQLGKSLPHNSRAQEDLARPVSKADAQPGDLVFIQDVAGHVGIYAGDGKMYDAPRSGKNVTLRSIWTSNYTLGRV